MPSPAIATTWPSPGARCTTSRLLLGQHVGLHLVDAELAGHGLRGGAVVAGQHHDAQPSRASCDDRLRRGLLDRIGDAEQAGDAAVERDEHHRLALGAQRFGALGEGTGIDAEVLEQRAVAERDARPPATRP
jgi:hypothetical protein